MTATQPRVSIITPSLNSGRFIADCLASVAAQSYPDIEHIVVDGESTDETASVLARHARPGLRVIVRKDRSMYEAINAGLDVASGEVVACLNADDLYFPDAVRLVVDALDANPSVDILFGDQLSLFTTRESFKLGYHPAENVDPWGRVLVYISQPSVFLRKRVFERVGGFDAELRAAADFDYWIRAFRAGAVFKKLRRIVVLVRMHGENLSLTDAWQREHRELKDRYLGMGLARGFWERRRLLRRRILHNPMTIPVFMRRLPREAVSFRLGAYYSYLVRRSRSATPILSVRLPYFSYDAFRAL